MNRLNQRMFPQLAGLLCILLTWGGSSAAVGQQPAAPDASIQPQKGERAKPVDDIPPDAPTEVVIIQHVSADDLARQVSQMLRSVRIAVDEHSNRLILAARPEMLTKAKELIAALDTPGASSTGRVTEFVRSPVDPGPEVMQIIQSVISREGRVAARGQLLAVTGSRADIAAVQRVMSELEKDEAVRAAAFAAQTTPRSLRVSFSFLVGSIGGADATSAKPLPEALAPVAAALQESGFSRVGLLAPVEVHLSDTGEEFNLTGSARHGNAPVDMRVTGQVIPEAPGEAAARPFVRLMVKADLATVRSIVHPQNPNAPAMMDRISLFQIETAIAAKLDEYVVLAASPTSISGDEAIALVVRVTEVK